MKSVLLAVLVVMIELATIAFAGHDGLQRPADGQLILILTAAAALLVRGRWPRAVVLTTAVCGSALPLFGNHQVIVDVASIVALYTLATATDRRTAWPVAAVAAGLLTVSSILALPGHLLDIHTIVPLNYVAVAVAVGDAVRTQRALLGQERRRATLAERTREEEARRRVREERVRIARDLHDVVAHHITLVNAQAGVAHHLLGSDPARASEALAGIRETSRAALDELRATVGLLRRDDEPESLQPAPSFDRLDDLIAGFRGAGHPVEVDRTGVPRPLTPTADLAAYRIVQEALTNAGKHGGSAPVTVSLAYGEKDLDLIIANRVEPGRRGDGTGNGLVGMRERAQIAGGALTAELRPDGFFVVTARLPLA